MIRITSKDGDELFLTQVSYNNNMEAKRITCNYMYDCKDYLKDTCNKCKNNQAIKTSYFVPIE